MTPKIPTKEKSARKNDILASMVNNYGLTWPQARLAYRAFTETIGDAVVNGQKVTLGEILTLQPVWKQPRTVALNAKIGKGQKLEKVTKMIYLGMRLKYVVNLHASFLNKRQINWF